MKLNKTYLKQLIQEELQTVLSEQTSAEYAEKMDMDMRKLVSRVVKSMDSYGYIVSQLEDLVGTYRNDEAKLSELTGVTKQDLEKVILLNKNIVRELDDIYTQMRGKVSANKA